MTDIARVTNGSGESIGVQTNGFGVFGQDRVPVGQSRGPDRCRCPFDGDGVVPDKKGAHRCIPTHRKWGW